MPLTDSLKNKFQSAYIAQVMILAGLLFAGVITAATMGYIAIPTSDVLKIIVAALTGETQILAGVNELFPVVVLDVRLCERSDLTIFSRPGEKQPGF